ncbi:LytR C-terminal domain-containing protein [Saccharothrix sp. Mg75]|uniref:LytR C-terminal domain-containing protein n=1 Tax=Saccharothrix sp. Mg75 TaxID=3445357 RepID=UPI003EE8E1F5
MTNPEQPAGSAQPARAAGYVLLGVAAIALVVGVVSLFTGGPDDEPPAAQSTPPSASSPAPGTDTAAPSTGSPTGSSTAPAESPGQNPTTTEPPATQPPATTPGGQGTTAPGAPGVTDTPPPPVTPKPAVRVYNNSTIPNLAARASDDVQKAGWSVAETGNYSQGTIPTTTVYYRPGTDEEESAKLLATTLGARVEARFDGIRDAHAGIIVIVTNDYRGPSGKVS